MLQLKNRRLLYFDIGETLKKGFKTIGNAFLTRKHIQAQETKLHIQQFSMETNEVIDQPNQKVQISVSFLVIFAKQNTATSVLNMNVAKAWPSNNGENSYLNRYGQKKLSCS